MGPFPGYGLFEKFCERGGFVREVLEKPLIKTCESQKRANVFRVFRGRPVRDGLHFVGMGFYTFAVDEESTELDFALTEGTLFLLRIELFSSQLGEDSAKMLEVFVKGTREDNDVVDVDFREVSAVCEEVVHYALECARGVA